MPGFDERLTRELERAARPAAPDHVRLFDDVTRRRAHRETVRKVQVVTSVVVVLALVAGAVLWLAPRFGAVQPAGSPTPPPATIDRAMLQLRPVLEIAPARAPGAPTPTCLPGRCTLQDLAAPRVVLRDRAGVTYTLGPSIVDGTSVSSAVGVTAITANTVALSLDRAGTTALARGTRAAVAAPPPQNRIAEVWDGAVVSAPTAIAPITSGSLQVRFRTAADANAMLTTFATPP